MRFDVDRALGKIQELGDPRFAGPDGETQLADFVAERFNRLGYQVERREVIGSSYPQRVALWAGWLRYCALITAMYVLALWETPRWITALAAYLLLFPFFLAFRWLDEVVSNRIRLRPLKFPRAAAPLVIASPSSQPSRPVRVVLQAVLGDVKPDWFHFVRLSRFYSMMILTLILWFGFIGILAVRFVAWLDPKRVPDPSTELFILRLATSAAFVTIWIVVLCVLWREYSDSRGPDGSHRPDRRGLALLLEMASSWSRSRSSRIEVHFIAAGGQRVDYAGSRAVLRLLRSEWPSKPTLIVLFFAPGAGEVLRLSDGMIGKPKFATEAAKSLWIPVFRLDPWAVCPFWPFDRECSAQRVEYLALIGSDAQAFFDATVSGQTLASAAQLATEIALRWAKKQEPSPLPDSTT
jgi:hypothetical protein